MYTQRIRLEEYILNAWRVFQIIEGKSSWKQSYAAVDLGYLQALINRLTLIRKGNLKNPCKCVICRPELTRHFHVARPLGSFAVLNGSPAV